MVKKINSKLSSDQKLVLFEEGTEPPGSSELNFEKRDGSYHCANCDIKLFESSKKYESGSGWPSFFESLPDVFETKTDHLIGYARTEYHCKNCGGHHGHIFDDGPKPTGKRYCNNGLCLVFVPKKQYHNIKDPKNLEHITNIFFSQRRKMIKKPIKFLFNNFEEISKKLSIDLKLRPQNLDHKTYYKICELYELELIK